MIICLSLLRRRNPQMKVYLASQYSRRPELREYAKELESMGIKVTSRWLFEEQDEEDETKFAEYAFYDEGDIMECNYFVHFTGPPYFGTLEQVARGGRHFETGFAHALRKKICIVGSRENSPFYYNPNFLHFPTWEHCKYTFKVLTFPAIPFHYVK